ncbi:MAG: hypothetical protein VB084_02090 [Syntrophomonadaceae bacterium]|nr:hypothetical protein [Syntrophomonadaceae bacterium]
MITDRITDKISIVICEGRYLSSDVEKTDYGAGKSLVLNLTKLTDQARKIDELSLMRPYIDSAEWEPESKNHIPAP